MGKLLTEMLAEAQGGPILFQDKEVRMSFRISVEKGQVVEIEFLHHKTSYEQGIEIAVDRSKGSVQVIEVSHERIRYPVFWTHTAPRKFPIKCFPKKNEGVLQIWNIWKNTGVDRTDAWIGNSGLYVEEQPDGSWVFHCSNGIDEVDFEDLVFRVRLL